MTYRSFKCDALAASRIDGLLDTTPAILLANLLTCKHAGKFPPTERRDYRSPVAPSTGIPVRVPQSLRCFAPGGISAFRPGI